MALSQVQCLDENHINLRTNESKPEFFYSEEQRLALEALLEGGVGTLEQFLTSSGVRNFLSELEVSRLSGSVEVFNPGSLDACTGSIVDSDEAQSSLQYWPQRSDTSLPDLDLGWPPCAAYRGVTRAHVYAQPPLDGHAHIKEVVRKTIAQAQKVIAVVMDLFTDVDIFKDLLDASFKRKVAVYVVLEATGVPHFLNMCERAAMHTGHLKNLRVRSIRGTEFFTRSSKKVCGSQSQKFMFVDGDKAVSGSYSFTWSASRLDRNIITVLTGQAVDTFDKLFQDLYMMSNGVNLNKINLLDEPKPEPVPQTAPAPLPSATMALKLINPKYALVFSTATAKISNTPSENIKQTKEVPEASQIHPGLLHLEKANMTEYLPVWPDPDPSSDVIGFINIRDYSKPIQAHLMRSELFEVSQAIRFKDPLNVQEEPLPGKAYPKPRLESFKPLVDSFEEQSLKEPQISPENNNMNAKPTDQIHQTSSRHTEESIFMLSSSNDENDSTVAQGMKKVTDSLSLEADEIHANPGKSITVHSDAVQDKDCQMSTELQCQTVTSSCTETLLAHFETISVKHITDTETESFRTTAVQDNPEHRSKVTGPDKNETKVVGSSFSSKSEEYFECSDSLTADSGFKHMVNGIPTASGLSEKDWLLDDSNGSKDSSNTVTHSLSPVTLQLQKQALMASPSDHESVKESLEVTESPQLQSGLQGQCSRQHITGLTIHSEPEDTEAVLVIETDNLFELVSNDNEQQMQETNANSQLASETEVILSPLEAKTDASEGKPDWRDRKGEELPLHELKYASHLIVNDESGTEPLEWDNANKSELVLNEFSTSVWQGKLAAPVIVVQMKTESQSIVFSDSMNEMPLSEFKPELPSRFNYISNFTPAAEVNDVKHSRHQEKVDTLHTVLQKSLHAKREHEEDCNFPAQCTDPEDLMIIKDPDLERSFKVQGDYKSVLGLKKKEAVYTLITEDKTEPPGQKICCVPKHSADVHSSTRKQNFSQKVLGKDKPIQEHTCTYREHMNQPEAKAKFEGDMRRIRRPSPKPRQTPPEARGGSTKASVTKLLGSNHPARPAANTSDEQNTTHRKQQGQNKAVNALPTLTALPDKFKARRTAPTRSSQSQVGHSRTDPSPARISFPQNQPQAQLDRTRAIQLGPSSSRQRSASTAEDSPSSSGTPHLRRSRSFKGKTTGSPLKQSENKS
ncbi:uncharacterized protein fam83ga [Hoplias malabaricus]|uniref:uncharacterized protein fam83ga n=1 Tax=Hoplias malabaricus TaxID=27720 RepID=UPI0034630594